MLAVLASIRTRSGEYLVQRKGLLMWRTLTSVVMVGAGLLVAGCQKHEAPFVPQAVPSDFSILLEERSDSYFVRQEIRQEITASDMMSHTNFTHFRESDNSVARKFPYDAPLNARQLQAMWDEVVKNNLMEGSKTLLYFHTASDNYKREYHYLTIRVGGQAKQYEIGANIQRTVRPLVLLAEAARLPTGQGVTPELIGTTQVVSPNAGEGPVPPPTSEATMPAPSPELPTTEPTTAPATVPAAP